MSAPDRPTFPERRHLGRAFQLCRQFTPCGGHSIGPLPLSYLLRFPARNVVCVDPLCVGARDRLHPFQRRFSVK